MIQYIHRLRQLLPLLALLVAAGCGSSSGPRITITWRSPKPEVSRGTSLLYRSIKIGEVEKTESSTSGFTVHARLGRKYAHYVTEDCTFVVRKGTETQPAHIEVRPLKKDSRPAMDGAVFAGAESDLEASALVLVTDWTRTAILAAVAVGLVILLVFLTKLLFKLWSLVVCAAAGVAAAWYFSPIADQLLRNWLPWEVRTDLIAYVVVFLAGYIIAAIIVGILKRPLRA